MQPDDDGSGKTRKLVAEIDIIEAIEAIKQSIKDLDAEVERINAAREAMPPPKSAEGLEGGRTWTGWSMRLKKPLPRLSRY